MYAVVVIRVAGSGVEGFMYTQVDGWKLYWVGDGSNGLPYFLTSIFTFSVVSTPSLVLAVEGMDRDMTLLLRVLLG